MIDAVIYGDTPNAKMEKDFNPPPDIKLKISKKPNSSYTVLIHGTVIVLPNANTPKQNSVKYIRKLALVNFEC